MRQDGQRVKREKGGEEREETPLFGGYQSTQIDIEGEHSQYIIYLYHIPEHQTACELAIPLILEFTFLPV